MLQICPQNIATHYKLCLTNLFVNVNIPLVGKMHMSHPFLKKVVPNLLESLCDITKNEAT
jgi:hypothetical protein